MENVYISAYAEDSWITYKKDQEEVKSFVLKKGRTLLIRGKEIRLILGNANATKIFYNNELIDIQSKSGVKSLVFPETANQKYKIPLFIYNEKKGQFLPSDEVKVSP